MGAVTGDAVLEWIGESVVAFAVEDGLATRQRWTWALAGTADKLAPITLVLGIEGAQQTDPGRRWGLCLMKMAVGRWEAFRDGRPCRRLS